MTDYDKICQEIFPLMSTWGRAIENGEPWEPHFSQLERIARQDPVTIHEAVTAAIGMNRMRAEYTMSAAYNQEEVGRRDPYLYGKTRQETHEVFIQRMGRNITLLAALGMDD